MNHSAFLTPRTAIIISMNAMIGAGIFAVPLALRQNAGPIGLVTVLITALMVWCLAFALGAIAEQNTHATSFYEYIKPWGGTNLASTVSILHTLGMIIAMSLLTQELGHTLHGIAPALPSILWSIIILVAIFFVILQGTALSTWGQYALACCTLAPLILISALCFSQASWKNVIPFAPYGLLPALFASKIVIFGYFGFECISALAPLLRNPQRDMPRILTFSIALVSAIYFLFIGSFIFAIPHDALNGRAQTFIDTLAVQFPHHTWLLTVINIAVISALAGTIHSMLWSLKGALMSFKHNFSLRPRVTMLMQYIMGIIVILCMVITSPGTFFSLTALCVVPTYFVTIATIFIQPSQFTLTTKICGIIGWVATIIITLSAFYTLL